MIQHDGAHPNQEFAIEQTIAALDGQPAPVLGILAGNFRCF
jgi:hypothetical protein